MHHGDGSQSIAWQLNERSSDSIGYYSLHDIYSYPCETGNIEKISEASVSISAHGHNVHNVHLRQYKDPAQFDEIYEKHYRTLITKAAQYLEAGFAAGEKCLVCISAGYDASEYESSGMQRHVVNVPTAFYERFTREIVDLANTFCNGKIFSVMEGGYGDRAITSAASAHMLGLMSPSTPNASDCYSLSHLKVLEKLWPCKVRNGRKSGKHEPVSDLWLQKLDELYSQYITAPSAAKVIPTEEDATLTSLQKMTLRDRKPRVLTTTPRSVRSTPMKSTRKNIPPVPKTPAIFDAAALPKDESPTPSHMPGALFEAATQQPTTSLVAEHVPQKATEEKDQQAQAEPLTAEKHLESDSDGQTAFDAQPQKLEDTPKVARTSNIYDFID